MSSSPIIVGASAKPLVGKIALVTGASRGIGAAIAKHFALAGANVAISYSASTDKANAVVEEIEKAGQKGLAIKADHSVQSEVTALIAAVVKEFGRIDILVNNAGIGAGGPINLPKFSTEEHIKSITRMFAINVTSVATAVRAAAPHIPSGGRIITIGSVLGSQVPFPGCGDYAATKSALQSYTKGWARDFGKQGVTVNLVQPGHIDTDLNPASGGPFVEAAKASPAGRHGTVDELAAAVLFLATPAASFVNASIFNVDGGVSA